MTRMNKTISLIVKNENNIENKTNELIDALNDTKFNYFHYIETNDILNQLKINLDSLLNQLNELENAITFTNLKILHPFIVSKQELENLIKDLNKIHGNS